MNRINIAIALDQNVLCPAYVMLRSLAINNSASQVYVYVLHSKLTKVDCDFLQDALTQDNDNNRMIFIPIDASKTANLPYNHLWSLEMYYRLMLPELLGDKLDRILYLDIDIIVHKDISDFYNMDFEGNLLIAAKDMEIDNILTQDTPEAHNHNIFFKDLIEKENMTYFCSGVLLMNLAALKEHYSFDKYLEIFYKISDCILLPDQDLLNFVHYKQVKFVDEKRFGLFTQTAHQLGMTYDDVYSTVSIFHFTGQAKPWTVNLIRYDIEKIWWEYAKQTPFYYEILEQVFFHYLKNHFVEDKIQEMADENNALKELLHKYQCLVEKLSS